MKIKLVFSVIVSLTVIALTVSGSKNEIGDEPWSSAQLLPPADLARIINDQKAKQPLIYSIGPGALINGSIDIGPVKEKENLDKFREKLSNLPKDVFIVIYCGCCPFEHCPNIRPGFRLLNEMKFTNHKLLNLDHNIRIDWINKGYPTKQ